MRPVAASVTEYFAGFPEDTQTLLEQLRATIIAAAPRAEEVISYAMPAYRLGGMLVYFAGYAKHIGFYPGAGAITAFKEELSAYKWAKGSVQFPLDKPLPLELVTRIVRFRMDENLEKIRSKEKKQR